MSGSITSPGKVTVYTYTPFQGDNQCCFTNIDVFLDAIRHDLENRDVGDELFLKIEEMDPEEIEALPEHEGW